MQYTISAVSTSVGEYQGKYGTMKTYKVKFKETGEEAIQISQKPDTKPPVQGEVVNGTITRNAYGANFKKDFQGGGGFGGRKSDPTSMYISYAKDLAVALINNGVIPTDEKTQKEFEGILATLLMNVKQGGMVLQAKAPEPTKDDGFGGEPFNESTPFDEPPAPAKGEPPF